MCLLSLDRLDSARYSEAVLHAEIALAGSQLLNGDLVSDDPSCLVFLFGSVAEAAFLHAVLALVNFVDGFRRGVVDSRGFGGLDDGEVVLVDEADELAAGVVGDLGVGLSHICSLLLSL